MRSSTGMPLSAATIVHALPLRAVVALAAPGLGTTTTLTGISQVRPVVSA